MIFKKYFSPLISLVDLAAPDEEHEGGDEGQVVGDQVTQS